MILSLLNLRIQVVDLQLSWHLIFLSRLLKGQIRKLFICTTDLFVIFIAAGDCTHWQFICRCFTVRDDLYECCFGLFHLVWGSLLQISSSPLLGLHVHILTHWCDTYLLLLLLVLFSSYFRWCIRKKHNLLVHALQCSHILKLFSRLFGVIKFTFRSICQDKLTQLRKCECGVSFEHRSKQLLQSVFPHLHIASCNADMLQCVWWHGWKLRHQRLQFSQESFKFRISTLHCADAIQTCHGNDELCIMATIRAASATCDFCRKGRHRGSLRGFILCNSGMRAIHFP
mmetsp:Transcript_29258/g.53918  ORF Transcript_29258/g.53918 Transcript_29258/m.53918 type:complete len:285 (+) Transcript_29258:212-1066(+)